MEAVRNNQRQHGLLVEVLNWIMDGEPLTTPEERERFERFGFVDDDDPIDGVKTVCVKCAGHFVQSERQFRRNPQLRCFECRRG